MYTCLIQRLFHVAWLCVDATQRMRIHVFITDSHLLHVRREETRTQRNLLPAKNINEPEKMWTVEQKERLSAQTLHSFVHWLRPLSTEVCVSVRVLCIYLSLCITSVSLLIAEWTSCSPYRLDCDYHNLAVHPHQRVQGPGQNQCSHIDCWHTNLPQLPVRSAQYYGLLMRPQGVYVCVCITKSAAVLTLVNKQTNMVTLWEMDAHINVWFMWLCLFGRHNYVHTAVS